MIFSYKLLYNVQSITNVFSIPLTMDMRVKLHMCINFILLLVFTLLLILLKTHYNCVTVADCIKYTCHYINDTINGTTVMVNKQQTT